MPKPIGHSYRVYVRHNWGTDKVIVTIKKRAVRAAGEEARQRAMRLGHTGVVVLDVIPMKYVAGVLIETRRMRVQKGKFQTTRKARARVTRRTTRRVATEGHWS